MLHDDVQLVLLDEGVVVLDDVGGGEGGEDVHLVDCFVFGRGCKISEGDGLDYVELAVLLYKEEVGGWVWLGVVGGWVGG